MTLSHRAVLATIAGLMGMLDHVNEKMGSDDVYLSFLPLAHIFDRWGAGRGRGGEGGGKGKGRGRLGISSGCGA